MEGNVLITGLSQNTALPTPPISQLLDPLPPKAFDSFALLSSNARAAESTRLFAARGATFVALVGPSGWGKSHLLRAAASRLQAEFYSNCQVMDASEWVHSPAPRDPSEPVILDNVQDAFERARLRLQLRLSLERRVRAGRPTLLSFTAPKPTRVIRSFLPSSKSWIISPVNAPDENERELLVRQMAADEGLKLSDCLVWLMSHRMNGNGCSLMGAFKRLALHNSQWTDPNMTLRACGLLDPCFRDCPSWDLRDHILTCAEEFVSDNMLVPRPVLAVFTMLRIAMLAEADVADYFEANQAALYRQAIDFESRVSDPEHYLERDEVLRFMRFVIAKLKA